MDRLFRAMNPGLKHPKSTSKSLKRKIERIKWQDRPELNISSRLNNQVLARLTNEIYDKIWNGARKQVYDKIRKEK